MNEGLMGLDDMRGWLSGNDYCGGLNQEALASRTLGAPRYYISCQDTLRNNQSFRDPLTTGGGTSAPREEERGRERTNRGHMRKLPAHVPPSILNALQEQIPAITRRISSGVDMQQKS
ncbi:hypothetical protein QQF64_027558 [Cirrhinus molitorella]|uniref:Uncharacterized protein n=1 Tax=Cirrhinus molitorella TaxID=172907 RepID=A0ABR3NCT3_9TELE